MVYIDANRLSLVLMSADIPDLVRTWYVAFFSVTSPNHFTDWHGQIVNETMPFVCLIECNGASSVPVLFLVLLGRAYL